MDVELHDGLGDVVVLEFVAFVNDDKEEVES